MTFVPPAHIPGLDKEAHRVIVQALRSIAADLKTLHAPAFMTSAVTGDRQCALDELVRCIPPAGGMKLSLPRATLQNQARAIRVAVEAVASGGSVMISVVGGQRVGDAAVLVVDAVGVVELVSLGPAGWGVLGASSSGGLTPIADESVLGNVSGAPAVPAALLLSSLAGSGLTWNGATNKFDVSGGAGVSAAQAKLIASMRG